MGINMSGTVKLTLEQTSKGDGAKAAVQGAEALKNVGEKAREATTATGSLTTRIGGMKASLGGVNAAREAFENLRSNVAFIPGLVSAALTAFTALIALIPDAKSETELYAEASDTASVASIDLSNALLTQAAASKTASINIGEAREAVLKLASANATATGDVARAAALAQKAAVQGTENAIEATTKQIDSAREQYNKLGEDVLAAETRQKNAAARATKLAFDAQEARRTGDDDGAFAATAALNNARVDQQTAAAAVTAARTQLKSLDDQIGVLRDTLKVQREAKDIASDTTIRFDELEFTPSDRTPRGGGSRANRTTADSLIKGLSQGADDNARRFAQEQASAEEQAYQARMKGGAVGERLGPGKFSTDQAEHLRALNVELSTFQSIIGQLAPSLGGFGSALSEIAQIWVDWGASGQDTEKAIVGSLGAIARAGAAQIKNEQLRAGVLSIIEFGLGWASYAAYDYGAAAAHWAASAILAGTAVFGGGGGSKKGAGASGAGTSANVPRIGGGESQAQSSVTFVINGNYYGRRSEQEASADFNALIDRARGTGYRR